MEDLYHSQELEVTITPNMLIQIDFMPTTLMILVLELCCRLGIFEVLRNNEKIEDKIHLFLLYLSLSEANERLRDMEAVTRNGRYRPPKSYRAPPRDGPIIKPKV